jgi:CHAT domain-containing protein
MLRGELAEAQQLADHGVDRERSRLQSVHAWRFRLLRAEIAVQRANFREALPTLGADLPPGKQFDELRARQRYIDAKRLAAQGQLVDALQTLEHGRSLASEGPDLQLDIDVLDGQIRARLGRWSEAEATLTRLVARAGANSDRYHEALALNNLGMSRRSQGRCDEAVPFFERVLAFKDLRDLSVYSAASINAGACYARLGEYERAIRIEQEGLVIQEQRGPRVSLEQALGLLGTTYLDHGKARDGLPYLQRAFRTANDAQLTADAALWAGNLADAYIDLEQWDEAERFNEEAKQLLAQVAGGRPVYNTLFSALIAAGRRQFGEATRLYEEVLTSSDTLPPVLWDAHSGLAKVALALKQPERAAREFEAALDVIERTRSGLLKGDYKLSYLTKLINYYREYVRMLVKQGNVERALEIADSSRGRVLAERQRAATPPRTSAAALRRLARQTGTVFLSYWLTPGTSYLWVVSSEGIRCLTLPSTKEIEPLVRAHQESIANVLADPLTAGDAAGDRLYRLLVAPAAKWLPRGASVVIVPDGPLHGINFETLPVEGRRRHYWIEDVEVQIAPSLAAITVVRPAKHPSDSLLLVGNPHPRPDYPALKYAASEMTNIARHFSADRVTAYDGDRASPASYREAHADRFSFIHFTAHAIANVDSPLDSAVILSGPDNAYKLYARDVAALPLSADLVTVSACRSAGERAYSGEGLVGFSWAFLRGGARRVIAGLWDVDDRSTSELMDRLYDRLSDNDPPSTALRRAKLTLLKAGGRTGAPYNWAPFELFTLSLNERRSPHSL